MEAPCGRSRADQVIDMVGARAENIFRSGQLACSEAVLSVLNESLHGGLPPEHAVSLAAGFPEGLGGSGCLCGALGGGVLALGLFLGRKKPGERDRRGLQAATKKLHDRFKGELHATCCRILTKKVKDDDKAHFDQCARITGIGARMAAEIILDLRPELIEDADEEYLSKRESRIVSGISRIVNRFRP